MKKNIKFYVAFWTVLVVVFHVIAFVSPGWTGQEKYTPSFWGGYVSIVVAFVVNLIFAIMALYTNDAKKLFYNISFFRSNYAGLILAFVTGSVFMLLPSIPYWICTLISVIVMGVNLVSLIKARTAAKLVSDVDDKIANNTQFIKRFVAETQSLVALAKNEEARQLAQKVYEAARYSDPVSNEQLAEVEQKIEGAFEAFATAIRTDSKEASTEADTVLYYIKNRNELCKALK